MTRPRTTSHLARIGIVTAVGVTVAAVGAASAWAGGAPRVTPQSTITTIVGTGVQGFSGDGGAATSATLYQPRDSALAPDGSLYVVDTMNNRIRKVAPDGTISTVAGTGDAGYSGDNGPAVNAAVKWPHDITVADDGTVYFADSGNMRVRRITTSGVITTIAGTGTSGYNGDNRLATTARLKNPKSVALFGGKLYFADGNNNRIRVVDLVSGIITSVAGNGIAGFSGDGGPATQAELNVPQRIALDSQGNIYIADSNNNRIRRVDAATGIITTIAGTGAAAYSGNGGPAVNAALNAPKGIALADDTTVYIGDSGNHRVRMIDLSTGIITTIAGSGSKSYTGDGGPAIKAGLYQPRGLTVDAQGNLLVADTFHNVIRKIWAPAG